MRWSAAAAAALVAGCYAPHVPANVPCPDPTSVCPDEQVCRGAVCVPAGGSDLADGPGSGGSGDDGTPGDRDGDGIADDRDNCPDVANTDQANEDGDRFGDACDPCPVVANDTPSDPDGDGVADECDPRPTMPGDKIVLFEGFANGIPADWAQTPGMWTAVAGGQVRVTAPLGKTGYLAPPIAPVANETVAALVVVESITGNNDNDIGIDTPYRGANDTGLSCELYQPGASGTGNRRISMFDYVTTTEFGQHDLAWTPNTAYLISVSHAGSAYGCAVGDGATTTMATGTSTSTVASPAIAMRAYAATARYAWLLVVSSP